MRAVVALATAIAAAAAAAPAQAAIDCGDEITESRTLKADITDCPGTGLDVTGDEIVLDLDGHKIDGALGDGIHVLENSSDVTIKGGKILDAGIDGVAVDKTQGVKLRDLQVVRGDGRGIQVNDSSSVNMKQVGLSRAAGAGIYLSGVDGGHLSLMGIDDVGGSAIDVTDINDVTIEMSTIFGGEDNDDDSGLSISGAEDSDFENLLIQDWGQSGVSYFSGAEAGNTFLAVVSRSNGVHGFDIATTAGVLLKEVSAARNDLDGLHVGENALNVKTVRSRFNRNTNGLVYDDNSSGSVGRNFASDNNGAGIAVPPTGVTDLGGNSASDNEVDCINVDCG